MSGFIGGSPKRVALFDSYTKEQMVDIAPWISTAVGGIQTLMFDTPAIRPPTNNSLFRYILLSEGMDSTGQYNDGVLINETITGSGVERQVTAEINLPESPLHGQVIHLINSERSHLRPSETAGDFEQDQMQRVTGGTAGRAIRGVVTGFSEGAFFDGGAGNAEVEQGAAAGRIIQFDSANSPGARTSSTTDGETRVKSVSAIYFLRIA